MNIKTEFPYNEYKGYIVINKENRRHVCLVHTITKQRTTTSYARYLISVKEGRILTNLEEVDHINGDKTDDSLDNLQILSKNENIRKSFSHRSRKMVEMTCPNCNEIFSKPLNCTHLQKKGKYTSCSSKCSYEVLKNGYSIEQLRELGKNQIIRHYRILEG